MTRTGSAGVSQQEGLQIKRLVPEGLLAMAEVGEQIAQ